MNLIRIQASRPGRSRPALVCLLVAVGCAHLPPDVPDSDVPTGGRLAVADGWLAGISRGLAPGPPVVFVHGFGGNRHFFDAQLAHVEDHARVIAYDQRGCGESSLAPRKKYDLDTLVTDLSVILDLSRSEQAVLVGHSFGADVVTRYAALHPDRVAALVLIDPPGDLRPQLAALGTELASADDAGFRRKVDGLVEKLLLDARPRTREAVLASVRATPSDVLQRMVSGMASFDPAAALASYQGPIRCLVTDHTVSRDSTAAPCRAVVRIHGVSHWPMLDVPDQVSQAIDEVLPGRR
jgi:pimeloyl-ACP methyl ester carboxylesterase